MTFRLSILCCCLLSFFGALAQKEQPGNLLSLLSSDQRFVRLAVDSSICLIRQDYTLINATGVEYGRNNDTWFGKKIEVGVITDSGIWVSSALRMPWIGDKNYDGFSKSDSLQPHLSRTWFRRSAQRSFTEWKNPGIPTTPAGALLSLSRPDSLAAIPCAYDQQDTAGWLILLSTKGDPDSDSSVISYNSWQPKLAASDTEGRAYIKDIPHEKNMLGGIYYACTILLGKIRFTAAGLLARDEKGAWYVQLLPGRSPRSSDNHHPAGNAPPKPNTLHPVNPKRQ